MEEDKNKVRISEHLLFDISKGKFVLNPSTAEEIYREKHLIESYSGCDEWCNHTMCELLDVCSGVSIYNHTIGCFEHEKRLPEWASPDKMLYWLNSKRPRDSFKKAVTMFEFIVNNLPKDVRGTDEEE